MQTAAEGAGPLLQRDYLGTIVDSDCTPESVLSVLLETFPRFSDPKLARFERPEGASGSLQVGDQMTVDIAGAGPSCVRITRIDAQSLTMRTVRPHPEAGRITFGAYYDEQGRLVFRIRSRARSADLLRELGFAVVGKHIQTNIWVRFIETVAEACRGRLLDGVRLETREVHDTLADEGEVEAPTFAAEREH